MTLGKVEAEQDASGSTEAVVYLEE